MKKHERRLVAFIDILGFSAYVKESIKAIRDYKVENGLTIDKVTDPNLTGLIG